MQEVRKSFRIPNARPPRQAQNSIAQVRSGESAHMISFTCIIASHVSFMRPRPPDIVYHPIDEPYCQPWQNIPTASTWMLDRTWRKRDCGTRVLASEEAGRHSAFRNGPSRWGRGHAVGRYHFFPRRSAAHRSPCAAACARQAKIGVNQTARDKTSEQRMPARTRRERRFQVRGITSTWAYPSALSWARKGAMSGPNASFFRGQISYDAIANARHRDCSRPVGAIGHKATTSATDPKSVVQKIPEYGFVGPNSAVLMFLPSKPAERCLL